MIIADSDVANASYGPSIVEPDILDTIKEKYVCSNTKILLRIKGKANMQIGLLLENRV